MSNIVQIYDEQVINAPQSINVLPRERIINISGATPNVLNNNHFVCNNKASVIISNFLNGQEGQKLYVKGDGKTTVANNSNIHCSSSANKLLRADVLYIYARFGGKWYEASNEGVGSSSGAPDYSYMTDRAIVIYDGVNNGLISIPTLADSYIDSAVNWNGKVDRIGDTMTGLLLINNLVVDNMLSIGDGLVEVGAPAGIINVHGDFSARTNRDGFTMGGLFQSIGNPTGILAFPSFIATSNGDFIGGGQFGAKDVDNSGGFTGLIFRALNAFPPYGTVTGTVHEAYGLKIDDFNFAAENWAIKTGLGKVEFGDNVKLTAVGSGVYVKEGTNATMGDATLVGGTVTIATTKVTVKSRIFVTAHALAGTVGVVGVASRIAGTSFTITSTSALDTSKVSWIIIEPA